MDFIGKFWKCKLLSGDKLKFMRVKFTHFIRSTSSHSLNKYSEKYQNTLPRLKFKSGSNSSMNIQFRYSQIYKVLKIIGAIRGIFVTIGDRKLVIWEESSGFWCLIICSFEIWKSPCSSGDIRRKPIFEKFFIIYCWVSHMRCLRITDPTFPARITSINCFYRAGFLLANIESTFNSEFNDVSQVMV